MYCLDSSVIIDIFDDKKNIKSKLSAISTKPLAINPIILCELYKGSVHSQVTERRLGFINSLLQRVDLLEFNEHACRLFGEDYLKLKRSGKLIKDADLMIATICKAHNYTLITSDKKHFENIPGLKVEVW
jgi:tRNA(fMet)-specific endonuclease VapC